MILEIERRRQPDLGDRLPPASSLLQDVDASSTGCPATASRTPFVAFTECQEIVGAVRSHGHQSLEPAVSFLKGNVYRPSAFVAKLLVEFFDDRRVGAVGIASRFDQRVKTPQRSAIAMSSYPSPPRSRPKPDVIGGSQSEIRADLRDTPNVVEHDEIPSVLDDDSAGFEDLTVAR